MKTLENKLIIYDSNCKICSSMKEVIVNVTSIPDAKIKAYKDLPYSLIQKVDPAKFRNEMALIDMNNSNTLYGAEGVSYIFSSQYKWVDWILRIKPLFVLFKFLYRLQAYNRYIIATPKSNFQCDCFPDMVLTFRLAYIALTFGLAVLLTMLFGNSMRGFVSGIGFMEAGSQMLLMAGTGWVLQMITFTLFQKEKTLDYLGHLGSIMVVGLLVLTPWIIFNAITHIDLIYLPVVSVLISSFTMLNMHIHRARHLEISQRWTVSWFLLLQTGFAFWMYFFYLK